MRTRIMNQLQALAMNEGYRWKKKLFSEQGRAQLAISHGGGAEWVIHGSCRLKDQRSPHPRTVSQWAPCVLEAAVSAKAPL
jgi:hypothetical protein